MTYYNEIDQRAAAWLRELQAHGAITEGIVDERSITDIEPADLDRYDRAHFFAGIGGWDLALRLAGWPANVPVWTGSCPCQPFSCAGKRKAQADERHLWPVWFRLICERHPKCIFGEQVASSIGHGWLDGVFTDLEGEGYTCGACVLGAHSVGAPHIRHRVYWVAYLPSKRCHWGAGVADATGRGLVEAGCATGGMDLSDGARRESRQSSAASTRHGRATQPDGGAGGLGNAERGRCEIGDTERAGANSIVSPSAWSDYRITPCADGKVRRIGTGIFPLAHGISGRVGLLRGYGNAIVPQVAAAFVAATMEELEKTKC